MLAPHAFQWQNSRKRMPLCIWMWVINVRGCVSWLFIAWRNAYSICCHHIHIGQAPGWLKPGYLLAQFNKVVVHPCLFLHINGWACTIVTSCTVSYHNTTKSFCGEKNQSVEALAKNRKPLWESSQCLPCGKGNVVTHEVDPCLWNNLV